MTLIRVGTTDNEAKQPVWGCEWCQQEGTIMGLHEISMKQCGPGKPVYEEYDDVGEKENEYINIVRTMGFDEVHETGKECFAAAAAFVHKKLNKRPELSDTELWKQKATAANAERHRQQLARILNTEDVNRVGRVQFTEEDQNEVRDRNRVDRLGG